MAKECFNPLNQVHVFNRHNYGKRNQGHCKQGFNPLNQVYVFNVYFTDSKGKFQRGF